MGNNNATLETLAAFAICFAAGALSSLGLSAYIAKLKKET